MSLTLVPAVFVPTQALVGLSATLMYQVPATGVNGAIIRKGLVINTSGAVQTVTLWRVAATDAGPITGNEILAGQSIAVAQSYILNECNGMVLGPSDAIWAAVANASALNLFLSGFTY